MYNFLKAILIMAINRNKNSIGNYLLVYLIHLSFRSTKCEYLDGSCLASPRWVSLLVAEIYYPDATFPNPSPNQNRNPVQGGSPPGPGVSLMFFDLLKELLIFCKSKQDG